LLFLIRRQDGLVSLVLLGPIMPISISTFFFSIVCSFPYSADKIKVPIDLCRAEAFIVYAVVPKSPLDEIVFILHLFSIKIQREETEFSPFEYEIE
jgi:hypothetical protein